MNFWHVPPAPISIKTSHIAFQRKSMIISQVRVQLNAIWMWVLVFFYRYTWWHIWWQTWAGLTWFGKFHHPAWAIGSYSSGHQPGELPKSKSAQPRFATRCVTLYSRSHRQTLRKFTIHNNAELNIRSTGRTIRSGSFWRRRRPTTTPTTTYLRQPQGGPWFLN